MNTQLIINEFIDFILREETEPNNLGELLRKLDSLAKSVYVPEFKFDENEYPEPPESNYSEIRAAIEKKFPQLGFYCTVDSDVSNIEKAEILTGDAVDDLADIVGDLIDVKWFFENTTENNALWHLEFDYRSHWGLHLRELQLYLVVKQLTRQNTSHSLRSLVAQKTRAPLIGVILIRRLSEIIL